MNGIYLLLGSNIGDRLQQLREASALLEKNGIKILEESSIYETEPWGNPDQNWFLNVVLEVETASQPMDMLRTCLAIEQQMGRERKEKWGARLIDIDILYYHNGVIDSEDLVVPHPGIPDRRFTLLPLVELCPHEMHPSLHQSQVELLANCTDRLACRITDLQL